MIFRAKCLNQWHMMRKSTNKDFLGELFLRFKFQHFSSHTAQKTHQHFSHLMKSMSHVDEVEVPAVLVSLSSRPVLLCFWSFCCVRRVYWFHWGRCITKTPSLTYFFLWTCERIFNITVPLMSLGYVRGLLSSSANHYGCFTWRHFLVR